MSKIGFDFDGTLLDSKQRHVEVLSQGASELDILLPNELLQNYVDLKAAGKSGKEVLARFGVEKVDELIEYWISHVEDERNLRFDKLYPGVNNYLNLLSEKGHKLYLVTARAKEANAYAQIKSLQLNNIFEQVFVVTPDKTFTAGQLKANVTKALHLDYVIGDTEVDKTWAEIIGAKFFPVNYGFRNKSYWDLHKLKNYDDLEEIINFVKI